MQKDNITATGKTKQKKPCPFKMTLLTIRLKRGGVTAENDMMSQHNGPIRIITRSCLIGASKLQQLNEEVASIELSERTQVKITCVCRGFIYGGETFVCPLRF